MCAWEQTGNCLLPSNSEIWLIGNRKTTTDPTLPVCCSTWTELLQFTRGLWICPGLISLHRKRQLSCPVVIFHPSWCLSGPPGLAEEIRSLNLEEFLASTAEYSITSWMSAAVDLIPLTFLLSGPLPLQTTLSPPWRLNLMMTGWMSGLRGSNWWQPAGWVELLPTKWPLRFPHHSRRHLFVLKLQLPSITAPSWLSCLNCLGVRSWSVTEWLTRRTGGKWVQLLLVSQISRWCSSNQGYFQICVLMISSLYECSVSANTSHMISCMRTSFILLLFSMWICKFKGCKYDYSNKISSHRVE